MNTIAAISVILGIVSAIIIASDLRSNPQMMKIMNSVWILTGLWAGLLAVIAYFWFTRRKKTMPKMVMPNSKTMDMTPSPMTMPKMGVNAMSKTNSSSIKMPDHAKMDMTTMDMTSVPHWQSITLSTLHCGAGCTLADLIGEWFMYWVAITIGGSLLLGSVVIDYALALIIGVYFQYSAIRSISSISPTKSLVKAIKADVLSLTAWQIGMYGFMAIAYFVFFPQEGLSKDSWIFWFMMQIAMFCGFMISFPMNLLLIKWGVKKAM